ncbi:hypothetical protein [Ideonella sp. B508-1]|uniref:hypothetical protein n=1 Tax=Ideonella sp. B508-1 TaxID=137716 RepID=UPI000349CD22|nr:hypothetical protein [Ideonella sp. B508-1]
MSNERDAFAPGQAGQGISQTQYNLFGTNGGTGLAFEDVNVLADRMVTRAGELTLYQAAAKEESAPPAARKKA